MINLAGNTALSLGLNYRGFLGSCPLSQFLVVIYETMSGNFKTKSFNLEDTHITDPDKLSTLLVVLALAVALSVKTGAALARLNPIPLKKHGRRAWSLFALGLHGLRKIFVSPRLDLIFHFLTQLLSPSLPLKPLMNMGF